MKIIGLDLGDRWVGIAISDGLQMTCRPLKTVTLSTVVPELQTLLKSEQIERLIIGLPRTMRGTESDQTAKIRMQAEQVITELNLALKREVPYTLWDERLSSRMAQNVMIQKNAKKQQGKGPSLEHAVAAAFILQTYLDSKAFHAPAHQDDSP